MKTKQTITIALILIFLITAVLIFFLILPTLNSIKKISQEISGIKSDLEEIEKRTEAIKEFKKKFPAIKEDLFQFQNSFVDKEFPIDFINFLEGMIKNYQVLSEIKLIGTGKDFLSFQINASGSPQEIFRLLEKTENIPYLVQIEKITLSKVSESELKEKKLETTLIEGLKLVVYFKVQTK